MTLAITTALSSLAGLAVPPEASAAPVSWIANAELWLKADEGVTTATYAGGPGVEKWDNQAGTIQFNATGGPGYKAAGANFNPVVTFNNTGRQLSGLNQYLSGNGNVTFADAYAVFKGGGSVVGSVYPMSTFGASVFSAESNLLYTGNGAAGTYLTFPFSGTEAAQRFHLTGYDTSGNPGIGRLNGSGKPVTNYGGNAPMPFTFSFTPMIGGSNGGGYAYNWINFNGELAEVMLFSQSTAAYRDRIESYLALKYGLTLDNGGADYVDGQGSAVWSSVANAVYGKRITGIGRDSGSTLNQRQSKSADEGALVTLAADSAIRESNQAIPSGTLNDNAYLIFGDNDGAVDYQTFVAGTTMKRMDRTFKAVKTGDWTSKQITFQLDASALSGTVYLLVSSDGAFNSASRKAALSATGEVTLNAGDLGAAEYFTFARMETTPGGVSDGLISWVNVEKSADSKTAVGSLNDLAVSSRTWTQGGTLPYNVAAINFNAGIQGSGASYYKAPAFGMTDTEREVFSVQTSTLTTNAQSFPWDFGGNPALQSSLYGNKDGGGNIQSRLGSAAVHTVGVGDINLKNPRLLDVFASDQQWALSVDGKELRNEASASVDFTPPDMNNLMYYMGAAHFSVFRGDLSEVIVYNRKLSDPEKRKVNSYMALKYGLTLDNGQSDYVSSATGVNMWTASKNVDFGRRITGIGKDDVSGLEQKQSKSGETGALVTLAAGNEIKASNEAFTAGAISNDLSFLTFSDNDGSAAYSVPVDGTNVQRMARAFKVDKTNWQDGDVTLQLDGAAAGQQTYLVIGGDAGFTGTPTLKPLTNGKVTLNSSELTDGSYFTFAQAPVYAPGGVSGASLWLRADKEAAADGQGQLTGWNDQTGTNHFTVHGEPVYKAEAANFNPAVAFNNTTKPAQNPNQYLLGDTAITYQDGFAVFKLRDGTIVGSAAPRPGGYGAAVFSKWGNLYVGNGAGGTYRGFPFNDASRYYLAGFDAAAPIGAQGTLNGTAQTVTGNNSFNRIDFTPVIGGTFGGGSPNNWSHYKGELAEAVLFPASTSAEEKQRIQSYLALKYGMTLNGGQSDYMAANGSDKMWTAGANAGYGSRITGIGRDDASGLLQKQSKSQSQDALVTIALGDAVKASNAENMNAFSANSSFFVFGDNNGTNKFEASVEESAGHTLKQWNREFKVEKTNWQDRSITLKLDVTNESPAVRYYLIIDGVNSGITLDAAGQATFDSALLGSGSVFTFAKTYKHELATKLSGLKGLTQTAYTPDSWAALQLALTEAEAVLNEPGSTQAQIDAAIAALTAAQANLSGIAAQLEAKVAEITNAISLGSLKPGDYTAGSWNALTGALDAAGALLLRTPPASPLEVGAALSALEAARGTLVDLSGLRAKVAEVEAEQLNPAGYTPASWQPLQQALAEAQAVLANPNATQGEVNAAKLAVEAARAALVPSADKTALQAKANEIAGEALTEADYTPDSWAGLQQALARAEATLGSPEATQQEVDEALAALLTARGNLVKEEGRLAVFNAVYSDINGNPVALALSPPFDGKQYLNYAAVVPNAVDTIGVAPEAADLTGTISVTLNGVPTAPTDWSHLPLKEGVNLIQVETTGPNGGVNVYTLEVVRATGKLQSLTPSQGSLSPAFAPDVKTYQATVRPSTGSLQWTPVTLDPLASIAIAVNGEPSVPVANGAASVAFPLRHGANTFVVTVTDRTGEITSYTISVYRASSDDSSGGASGGGAGGGTGSGTGTGTGAPGTAGLISSANGKDADFATGIEVTEGDRKLTRVAVDGEKLDSLLLQGNGQKFAVHVPGEGGLEAKGLTAEHVRQLAATGSSLEIGDLLAIYPIPSAQLNLNEISERLDRASLREIAVEVGIKPASETVTGNARAKAAAEGYELLVSPVDLSLSFASRGVSAQAEQLNGYAVKYIALPAGIDPNRITTGVVVNPDGTVFHLPTVITKINSTYFAMINDLRSSGTYSVIWNPQDFEDVRTHWARTEVNDIAARLDLAGTGSNTFSPDRPVIRSEFSSIVATGMGLMRQNVAGGTFDDVAASSWYHDAVVIANEFGIVLGYDDGLFHGERQITREQGIAMIARAYHLIAPQAAVNGEQTETILSAYGDAAEVSAWAKEAVALMIKAGIVEGRSGEKLDPQESISRAEASALMRRLLKVTQLID